MEIDVIGIIKAQNEKILELEKKMDDLVMLLNKISSEKIEDNTVGLEDLASITSDHDAAILELAEIIGGN